MKKLLLVFAVLLGASSPGHGGPHEGESVGGGRITRTVYEGTFGPSVHNRAIIDIAPNLSDTTIIQAWAYEDDATVRPFGAGWHQLGVFINPDLAVEEIGIYGYGFENAQYRVVVLN